MVTSLNCGNMIDERWLENLARYRGFCLLQPIFPKPVRLLGNADAAIVELPEIDQKEGDAVGAGRVNVDHCARGALEARFNPGLIHDVYAMHAAFIEPLWHDNVNGIANCKITHSSPHSSANAPV